MRTGESIGVLKIKMRSHDHKKIDKRYENGSGQSLSHRFASAFFRAEPSIENGFKSFEYEKVCAMTAYFANKCEDLLKVKLLKLLNYSDMIFYQRYGTSMSGMKYVHLPYGPVPQNYDILFGMMEADQVIHIEIEFDKGYERHRVIPDCADSEEGLTQGELDVLNQVYEKFADFGSVEISNYSHKEAGYLATQTGEVISYKYAKDIHLE